MQCLIWLFLPPLRETLRKWGREQGISGNTLTKVTGEILARQLFLCRSNAATVGVDGKFWP